MNFRNLLAKTNAVLFNGERDLYETCGWKATLTEQDFLSAYLRQDIAGRIVDILPDACWRDQPVIDDPVGAALEKLDKRLNVWSALHRLDRLASIGRYGALFIGVGDGRLPSQPMGRGPLTFLQPHYAGGADIVRWETDPRSPRYGKPAEYALSNDVDNTGVKGTVRVHWSRVVHVAENPLNNTALGTPRLERVWNRLTDLNKLLGSSAEIYWQNAAQLMAFIADKDAEWGEGERDDMREQIEAMQHGLQRSLRLRGVEVERLTASVADAAGHIGSQLDMIAGASGIPKRILIGSERGELASSQDAAAFSAAVIERREQFLIPNVVRPFVRKLQRTDALPDGEAEIDWPDSSALAPLQSAELAEKRANALKAYAMTPGAELIVSHAEFREWLGAMDAPEPDETDA